jgi:hypothetical protein
MDKKNIIGLIRSNLFTIIFPILILINIVILLIINGPFWGFFCITLFFWLCCTGVYIVYQNLNKRLKPRKVRNIVLLLTIFISLLLFTPYIGFMTHLKAEANRPELKKIVTSIIVNATTDEAKTKALLEWFNISKNNIYNNYFLKIKGVLGFGSIIRIYLGEPYIGIRTFNDKDSLWILTSRYGHCGEYALIFRDMADAAGLSVRRIRCFGEDHEWNEVIINGTWMIIDATRVGSAKDNGYNVSVSFMENKVAGDRRTPEGNVSYVIAEYLNGTTVDVTDRYTDVVNISILAIDEKGNTIPDVKIKVKSNNRYTAWNTRLNLTTDKEGLCKFSIGGGDYIIELKSDDIIPLYNEISKSFSENISTLNMTIMLKTNWTKIEVLFYGVFIGTIIIGLSIFVYYWKRKKNVTK